MRFVIRTSLIICFIVVVLFRTGHANAGGIEYPAAGNIDLEEGTLEIWFTPKVDLYPKSQKYRGIFSFFYMKVPDHFSISGGFHSRGGASQMHFSIGHATIKDALLPVPSRPVTQWQRDQVCHLALSWKGKVMKSFANGKHVGTRNQSMGMTGRLGNVSFVVGNGRFRDTPIILHAVRISSIARNESELTDPKPRADIFTLFLDQFDRPEHFSDGKTKAQIISGFNGEVGGELKGTYHVVTGPSAGIALFRESSKKTK